MDDTKDAATKSPDENIAADSSSRAFANKASETQSKSVLAEATQVVNASQANESSTSKDRKRESGESSGGGDSDAKRKRPNAPAGDVDPEQPCCSRSIREVVRVEEEELPEADLPNFQSDEEKEIPLGDVVAEVALVEEQPVEDALVHVQVPLEVAPDTDSEDSSSAEDPGPVPNNVPRRRRRQRRPSSTDEIVDLSSDDDEEPPATPNPPGHPPTPQVRSPRPRPTLQELLEFEWEDIPDDPSMT